MECPCLNTCLLLDLTEHVGPVIDDAVPGILVGPHFFLASWFALSDELDSVTDSKYGKIIDTTRRKVCLLTV